MKAVSDWKEVADAVQEHRMALEAASSERMDLADVGILGLAEGPNQVVVVHKVLLDIADTLVHLAHLEDLDSLVGDLEDLRSSVHSESDRTGNSQKETAAEIVVGRCVAVPVEVD